MKVPQTDTLNPPGLQGFDHVTSPSLRRLLAYWLRQRGGRDYPAREDIDPLDIPWALDSIWLCDHLPHDDGFRYRLAGERIREVYGRGLGGRTLQSLLSEEAYPTIVGYYRRVIQDPAIVHAAGYIYWRSDRGYWGERLMLPLGREGARPTQILGMTVYELRPTSELAHVPLGERQHTVTPVRRTRAPSQP